MNTEKQPKPVTAPPSMHTGGVLLKSVLMGICVASFWLAVLVMLMYRAGNPALLAAVLATCGTTAAGVLAVCDACTALGLSIRIAMHDVAALSAKSRR